jgi:chromosome segregation ATPase
MKVFYSKMSEEKLKMKIELLNSKLREVDDELITLEDKYIKERDRNDLLYKTISDMEIKNKNLEKDLTIYEEDAVKAKNDMILKDIAIKTSENKISALTSQLNSMNEMNESLKKSLGDLEKYVEDKKDINENENKNEYNGVLEKELEYERDRVVKLQHDINLYKNECNRLAIQITEFERTNIELENKLMFMSQKYMKDIKPSLSLEYELKIKKYEEEILTLQSQNKGLNNENLKLINENYTLRFESQKCFCSIQ